MKIKPSDMLVVGLAGVAVLLIVKAGGLATVKAKVAAAIPALSSFKIPNPFVFDTAGASYTPTDPGNLIWSSDLMKGTINDIYSGNTASYATPRITQITADVLSDLYGTKPGPMATW